MGVYTFETSVNASASTHTGTVTVSGITGTVSSIRCEIDFNSSNWGGIQFDIEDPDASSTTVISLGSLFGSGATTGQGGNISIPFSVNGGYDFSVSNFYGSFTLSTVRVIVTDDSGGGGGGNTEADPQDAQSNSQCSNVDVSSSGATSKSFQANPTGEGFYDRFGNVYTSPQNSSSSYLPVGQANGDGTNPSCRVVTYFEFNINSEIDPSDTITQAFIRLGIGSNSEAGAPRFGVAGCLNRTTIPTTQSQAESMVWSIPSTAEISHDSYTGGNTVDLGCEQAIKSIISSPNWSGGKLLLGLVPLGYSTNDQFSGNRHQFHSLYSSSFGGQRAQLNLNWDDYGKSLPSVGVEVSANPDEAGVIDQSGTLSLLTPLDFGGSSTDSDSSFMRFDNLSLSQGSTITSARIIFSSEFTSRTAENRFMQGASFEIEDSDDSATTSGSTGAQILARARTGSVSASVYNDESVSTVADQPVVHPGDKFVVDVTELVQSVVNRAGWIQGSAIMIVGDGIDFGGTITNQGSVRKYTSGQEWDQEAPLLEITSNSVLGTLAEPESLQSSSEVSETNVVKSALPITVDSVEVAANSEQIDVVPNATAQSLEVAVQNQRVSILAVKTPTRTIHIW